MLTSLTTKQFLILAGLLSAVAFCCGARLYSLLALNLVLYLVSDWEHCLTVFQTLPRDLRFMGLILKIQLESKRAQNEDLTVPQSFERLARSSPYKIALISIDDDRNRYTFQEADALANQIANYFRDKGFRKGDCVALFMENCPEYLIIWIGLAKLGVITALINFNQKQKTLAHSLKISKAKAIIYGAELHEVWKEANDLEFIENNNLMQFIVNKTGKSVPSPYGSPVDLLHAVSSFSRKSPNLYHQLSYADPLIYIYTSGTTGLPKAAVLNNARYYMTARAVYTCFDLKKSDRLYLVLPMYHTAGGILGSGQCLVGGCSLAIRSKFSASRFWDECIKYNCTVSQYIGETCRYLLAQPYRENETKHQIRIMYGNGLRQGIWMDFKNRFKIPFIGEFYGSTEGNTASLNIDGYPGACGFMSVMKLLTLVYPAYLIKVDPDTGEPVRTKDGLCIRCKPGEHGEMVGKIIRGDPLKDFVGYLSKQATQKKILYDVIKSGDVAFSSGDVLYMDKRGYLFFRDRTGDTFRWKGENVSTTEVEGVVQEASNLVDATVYGVKVPNTEGAAGMAAICGEPRDLDVLYSKLKEKLPNYAIPIFLRFCKSVAVTGTFKLNKVTLRKEGYNPSAVGEDRLFYLKPREGIYEILTPEKYAEIQSGLLRL